MTETASNVTTLPAADQAAGLPWEGTVLPEGYALDTGGVHELKGEERKKIAGPIWVTAKTRSGYSTEWGIVANWIDHDGKLHTRAFPAHRLYEQRSTIPQELADGGLAIVSGQERRLIAYLAAFETDDRREAVNRVGWLDKAERLVFVLPAGDDTRVIGQACDDELIFQPERNLPSIESMHSSGTHEQWQWHVAHPCRGNPILLFGLSTALASPLLRFTEGEGGVFHIYGRSSTGKTTTLQVGASVWGCGADPGARSATLIRRWNTTGNALEATATAFNDTLLCLDEMGSCAVNDFGKLVYDLVAGQGKARLTKNADLREQRHARILALSTGEISLTERIEQDLRRRTLAGHRTRFVDVPTAEDIIVNTHEETPHAFVSELKRSCGRFYGIAGPEFLRRLIEKYGSVEELQNAVREGVEVWTTRLQGSRQLAPHQERILRRFALVFVAGLMAIDLGVLPIDTGELKDSIEHVVDLWLGQDQTEGERGLRALRDAILGREGQFADVQGTDPRPREVAGYKDPSKGLYYFTDAMFRDACDGHSTDAVLGAAEAAGLLETDDGRRKKRPTIHQPGGGTARPWLYAIRAEIRELER